MQLPSEFVLPRYDGRSIANIPATVANLLDVPFSGAPPLEETLWQPLRGDVKRVIVILLDAFGWNILQREHDTLPLIDQAQVVETITSVFPSTTVNALSCVWTGTTPAQHGLVGLRLFFPEHAVLGQMISFKPVFHNAPDALVKAGTEPEQFLATMGVGTKLTATDVAVHAFKGKEIANSALSKMHGRGITGNHGAVSMADMLWQTCQLVESNLEQKLYAYLYWPTVDTLSHVYGPFGGAVSAEAHTLLHQIKTHLLDTLSPAAREGTVVCITSDHGHTVVPVAQNVYASDHPQLQQMLLMRNAGEPRVPYFYVKQGRVRDVVNYVNDNLADVAVAMTSDEALERGLFGSPPYAPQARDRLGDVVMIMRHGALWLNPKEVEKAHKLIGRHGSLSADEMEAIWLGFRLD